MYNKNVDI